MILKRAFEDADSIVNVSATAHSGDIVLTYKGKRIMIEVKNK